jgi:hypothetical protein
MLDKHDGKRKREDTESTQPYKQRKAEIQHENDLIRELTTDNVHFQAWIEYWKQKAIEEKYFFTVRSTILWVIQDSMKSPKQ